MTVSFLQAIIGAFGSRSVYRRVAEQWRVRGFVYLFFLVLLSWVPATVRVHGGLASFREGEFQEVARQMPAIRIRDGSVHADVEQPHVIEFPDDGKGDGKRIRFVIDTTGQVTSLDDVDQGMLLTGSALIVKKDATETRTYDLSEVKSFDLDRARLERWTLVATRWGPLICFPFLVLGSFVYRALQALLYSLLGLAIARSASGRTLAYGGVLAVAILALTPPIALRTLLGLFDVHRALFWPVYIGLTAGFLVFGLSACRGGPDGAGQRRPSGGRP